MTHPLRHSDTVQERQSSYYGIFYRLAEGKGNIQIMAYPYQIKSLEEYRKVYQYSVDQPEEFWGGVAEHFTWQKKWDKVLEWNFREPDVKWFLGGKLNITENCLDMGTGRRSFGSRTILTSNTGYLATRNFILR